MTGSKTGLPNIAMSGWKNRTPWPMPCEPLRSPMVIAWSGIVNLTATKTHHDAARVFGHARAIFAHSFIAAERNSR